MCQVAVIRLNYVCLFSAIKIKFGGRGKTKWSDKKSYFNPATKKSTSNNVLQYAEETYIIAEYNLIEGKVALFVQRKFKI